MIINLPESNYPFINGFTSFVHKVGGLTVMWIVIGLALLAFLTFFAYALLDSHTRVLHYATRIFGVGFLCVAGLLAKPKTIEIKPLNTAGKTLITMTKYLDQHKITRNVKITVTNTKTKADVHDFYGKRSYVVYSKNSNKVVELK